MLLAQIKPNILLKLATCEIITHKDIFESKL